MRILDFGVIAALIAIGCCMEVNKEQVDLLEVDDLLNDARGLAEHLGCTDDECIEDALTLIKDNHQEMLQLEKDGEIDDDYADSDQNDTICQWSNEEPQWKYPKWNKKIMNTSCMVIQKPAEPYPDNVNNWKQKRAWRQQNAQEWLAYRRKVQVARRNATFYMPYDQEKCDEINGTKSKYYLVPWRYATVRQYKNCPLDYPNFPDPKPDNGGDNDTDHKNETDH